MKTKLTSLFAALALFVCAFPLTAVAQEAAVAAPISIPSEVQNIVLAFVVKLAVTHPWVATLISLMGMARLWAKPLSSIVHQFVQLSPSKRDDDFLRNFLLFFHQTRSGRFLAYVIDWLTSIKIQPPA